jgi:hypothetical protein
VVGIKARIEVEEARVRTEEEAKARVGVAQALVKVEEADKMGEEGLKK